MLATTARGRAVPAALAAVAAALLWLGTSPAAAFKGGHFEGTVNLEPTSQVSFDLVKKKKKIGPHRWRRTTKIENVTLQQALAGCGGGQISPIGAAFPGSLKLKQKGSFAFKANTPGVSLFFKGDFLKRFGAAYGEFHMTGSFLVDGVTSTCDTGPRGWEAQRTSSTDSR